MYSYTITAFPAASTSLRLATSAIGGVKLQVLERDLNRTIEILKETGYVKE